jgi:hypothetical protein
MELKYWHTFFTAQVLLLQQEMLHCGYWPQKGVALAGYWKAVEYKLREMLMRFLCPAGQNNTL